MILFSTEKTTSESRWEVANKFDNLVIWIFDSALRIYLCISTGISFVWHDSAFCLGGLLEVDTTVDMRVVGVVVILYMCELQSTSCFPHCGFNYLAHTFILFL